jgi:hypothetical protein
MRDSWIFVFPVSGIPMEERFSIEWWNWGTVCCRRSKISALDNWLFEFVIPICTLGLCIGSIRFVFGIDDTGWNCDETKFLLDRGGLKALLPFWWWILDSIKRLIGADFGLGGIITVGLTILWEYFVWLLSDVRLELLWTWLYFRFDRFCSISDSSCIKRVWFDEGIKRKRGLEDCLSIEVKSIKLALVPFVLSIETEWRVWGENFFHDGFVDKSSVDTAIVRTGGGREVFCISPVGFEDEVIWLRLFSDVYRRMWCVGIANFVGS